MNFAAQRPRACRPVASQGHPPGRQLGWALLVLTLSLFSAPDAQAQTPPGHATSGASSRSAAPKPASKPSWNELDAAQKAALQPLAPIWNDIGANRKRKWVAMSTNFSTLSAADQATLQGRMREWASLSTAERNRARLNFAQSKELTNEEKKARWEAYQALSPEQKRRLAAQATKGAGAAPAVTQMAPGKLAAVPPTRSERPATKAIAAKPASPASQPGTAASSP